MTTATKNNSWIYAIVIVIVVIIILLAILGFKLHKAAKEKGAAGLSDPGLPVYKPSNTGIAGGIGGINNEVPNYAKNLYKGIPKCIEVKMLQDKLNTMGANIASDGAFGPLTESALQKYFSRTQASLNDLAITPSSGVSPVATVANNPTSMPLDTFYIGDITTWGNLFN